jgi:hypothetical protein
MGVGVLTPFAPAVCNTVYGNDVDRNSAVSRVRIPSKNLLTTAITSFSSDCARADVADSGSSTAIPSTTPETNLIESERAPTGHARPCECDGIMTDNLGDW